MFEIVMFFLLFATGLGYFRQRKRSLIQRRADDFFLNEISEEQLHEWMQPEAFEIIRKHRDYRVSELVRGVFQGSEFVLFLLSSTASEAQCIRQTVAVIRLSEEIAPFMKQEKDLWLESDGQVLVVYKERQSMTCGAPMTLFLERIHQCKKRLPSLVAAG